MSEEKKETSAGRSRLPIWLGVLLLLASLGCLWMIWSQYQKVTASLREDQAELAALANQKKRYQSLLGMEPCKAAQELPAVEEKGGAAPVSESGPAAAGGGSQKAERAAFARADDVESACVFIASPNASGTMTGSGFFVAPGYVATNRHVVEKGSGTVLVTSKAMGAPARGKVVAIAPGDLDCAIVQVPLPAGAHIGYLPFAAEVKKTEKIGAWGYPSLVGKNDPGYRRLLQDGDVKSIPELSYSEGVVSAILDRTPKFIVHTAPISPGNSGGPLVNGNGEVAGINTQISLDEDSYRQASIAISGDDVKKFLAANGIKVVTGQGAKTE